MTPLPSTMRSLVYLLVDNEEEINLNKRDVGYRVQVHKRFDEA